MPALVKASPAVLAGSYALVRYSVSQTSDLTLSVEAEFVGLPAASDNVFKLGSAPPSALQNSVGFLSTLATYGSTTVPVLADCQVAQTNGLKTVTATYTAKIRPTSLVSARLSISVDESGNVLLTEASEGSSETTVVGEVGGAGATGEATGELLGATLSPGSALVETTVGTNWNSLSGTYTEGITNPISRSFSFDYLAYTVTVVATGGVSAGRARGGVGPPVNERGLRPGLSVQTRETSRNYSNSRGETRSEITSVGYYTY